MSHHHLTASDIIEYMESLRNEKQRAVLMRFFKTGPGQYGEGDEFLGLKVPQTREVVKVVDKDFPLSEVPELLMSKWHEVRLCGLLILVAKFEKLATKRLANNAEAAHQRDEILKLYLQYAERANNWDLVDLSTHKILGNWLLLPTFLGGDELDLRKDHKDTQENYQAMYGGGKLDMHEDYKVRVMDELAASPCLWKQRMSMVCTWKTIQQGDSAWCLRYAEVHLHHPHDLMQKAVGWMLREMGKRISMDLLREFLQLHAHEMPRTALRYAIEQMDEDERREWMTRKLTVSQNRTIRKVVLPKDGKQVMKVFTAAKGIMVASGNVKQWVNGYPSLEVVQLDIEKGGGFVIEDNGRIVAYFAFLPSPEPTYSKIYDGEWLDDTQAYHVIHRIASFPEVHGIFQTIMEFCFAREHNIRIDTHRDNHIMRHNIQKYGFQYCGIIHLANGDERLAYQRFER